MSRQRANERPVLARIAPAAKASAQLRATKRSYRVTLRPGLATPLWSALVDRLQPLIREFGALARLCRYLGITPQWGNACFRARTAMLDAERTLLLITWIDAGGRS